MTNFHSAHNQFFEVRNMFRLPESMKIYWNKRGEAKATATDITHIEAAIGSKLAKPYIEFVTQFGFVSFDDVVGVEMRCMFDYTIDFPGRKEIREGDIAFLEEPDRLIKGWKILTKAEFEDDEELPKFPPNYLPVGNDAGQGQILLELGGDHPGRVWYWPENEWAWGMEGNTWLGFVADDFYEFINKLRP